MTKPFERNEETEGMWVALSRKNPDEYYFYAPELKELDEIVHSAGVQDDVTYSKAGFYMETLPKWSRYHPDNQTECICKCGHTHYLEKPDTRDWRKAQGL